MDDFRTQIKKHQGKRICVMGGAGSLADDLKTIKADLYISTNGHGCSIVKPAYVLAMDEKHSAKAEPMATALKRMTDAPIISPHSYADYQLHKWPQSPRFVLSGMIGAWVSYLMGAKVVILAGMDGYKDPGYIQEAIKIARDISCPVRVCSKELSQVWELYNPKERFKDQEYPGINAWLDVDESIEIMVNYATTIQNVIRPAGWRGRVMRHEVHRLLKHKMVREI